MESNDDASGSISRLNASVEVAIRLAHNLRHLLMIMGQCLDSIRAEISSRSPIENDLAELDRSIDRAFHLTHQLLAIGHPAPCERVVVDVNQLVVDAEGMIERALQREITPDYRLAATRPHVLTDPYELEWVLFNLVMNSRDAMPKGGRLAVETADYTRPAPCGSVAVVRLTVNGTGAGTVGRMRHHTHPRPSDASDIHVGRLGNVATLVEHLGGWLEVDDRAGRGTAVQVDLPAADVSGGV
jgi:signal transduction histidine kinase